MSTGMLAFRYQFVVERSRIESAVQMREFCSLVVLLKGHVSYP